MAHFMSEFVLYLSCNCLPGLRLVNILPCSFLDNNVQTKSKGRHGGTSSQHFHTPPVAIVIKDYPLGQYPWWQAPKYRCRCDVQHTFPTLRTQVCNPNSGSFSLARACTPPDHFPVSDRKHLTCLSDITTALQSNLESNLELAPCGLDIEVVLLG